MYRVFAVVLATLLVGLAGAADDPKDREKLAKEDLTKMAGTWKVTAVESMGEKKTGPGAGPEQIVITGDKMVLKAGGKELMAVRIELDPTKKPKAMEWVKEQKKQSLQGIYEVTADGLKVAFPLIPESRKPTDPPIPRPRSFDTKGEKVIVLIAERAKR